MPVQPWSATQVLALAPDAGAAKAARGLGGPAAWVRAGVVEDLVWGLCRGSGREPYRTCVDLTGPAYRCSCPSRKFPCKHALGLLLHWADHGVDAADAPEWAAEWHRERAARATAAREKAAAPVDEAAARKRAGQRAERVAAGLDELDRWLLDQVGHGVADAQRAGGRSFDTMAARLVDAQAQGAAEAARRVLRTIGVGDGWAERMVGELGLLRLLVSGYRRLDELPPDLAATVRTRVGFTTSTEEVRSRPRVRDRWQVIGRTVTADERLISRRTWLRGADTRRGALLLSFAPAGRPLPVEPEPGTVVDADLSFYPGAAPLRAVLTATHVEPAPLPVPVGGTSVRAALAEVAALRAADPWLTGAPVLLDGVRPAGPDTLVDAAGDALPVHGEPPWWLLAVTGGHPATVAGELSPAGLRVLAAWSGDGFGAAPPGPDPAMAEQQLPESGPAALPADLLAAALVGTRRRPFTATVIDLGGRRVPLAPGTSSDGADALLDAVAVAVVCHRTGVAPLRDARPDDPAPAESRPAVSLPAAERLERLLSRRGVPGGAEIATALLGEWLRIAAERGLRVPGPMLPALLDAGRRHVALRAGIGLVAGERGRWLAGRRPDWAWLIASPSTTAPSPPSAAGSPPAPTTPSRPATTPTGPDRSSGPATPSMTLDELAAAVRREPAKAAELLRGRPDGWPRPLAEAVARAIESLTRGSTPSWQLRELSFLACTRMPVDLAEPLAALADELRMRAPASRSADAVAALAVALTFRHHMTEELR